ncbi:hypothetical protein [Mycobacterium branderi]|uniref:Uncharacterized protein n=1 Tax=Mycobacterium branderi TaxID=43348 RepID=A0A7I7W6I7_9MYCO|nr:hypothetical protein [Mycobacterium branderi]MCV7235633.1 hypothetical protein [Mycobacterium branderi]ORA29255.1 hypothetical protein BST20_28235 [Mycobacterium branderi]BBZ12680.1 hypothetical protein MBRA_28750 [Mycobacterium branderi]
MTIHPPVLDLRGPASGYHTFHPDRSLNFQCNRWLEWIGPEAYAEIAAAVRDVADYEEWIDAFLALADARSAISVHASARSHPGLT